MNPVWGMLAKSAVDDETIEEAIARIVAEHNDDETAHLETGQSLQSHKASEIIDHLAGSVLLDKLARKITIITNFESLDGWGRSHGGSGFQQVNFPGCLLGSNNTPDSWSQIIAAGDTDMVADFSKNIYYKSTIWLLNVAVQTYRFGIGSIFAGDGVSGIYFKISGGNLYACYLDDEVEHDSASLGSAPTYTSCFEITYDATTHIIQWFVDGVIVHTAEVDFVSPNEGVLCSYYCANVGATYAELSPFNLQYEQDL
jgi:hypothetical protein